jgi:hypothetical protein
MSDAGMEFQCRGQVLHAAPGKNPWEIESKQGLVEYRVILVAPDLSSRPVVLNDQADVESLAEQLDRSREVPSRLRESLIDDFASEGPSGAADLPPERTLIDEHKELGEKYQELAKETTQLDVCSTAFFVHAHESGLFRSLTLYDDRPPPPKAPVPVAALPSYLPDVRQVVPGGWEATSCTWDGLSVLYEVRNARIAGGIRPGRCLFLWGGPYHMDLSKLDPMRLTRVGPPPPPGTPIPPFIVRAAATTN